MQADKRILIYGTGIFGKWYREEMRGVEGFVDSTNGGYELMGLPVYKVTELDGVGYDEIHVANFYLDTVLNLFKAGVPKDKIVIAYPDLADIYREHNGGVLDLKTNLIRTKFDLKSIVEDFDFEYCIIKVPSEFPALYARAHDVDIFCADLEKASQSIKRSITKFTDIPFEIDETLFDNGQIFILPKVKGSVDYDTRLHLHNDSYYGDADGHYIDKKFFYDCLKHRVLKDINGCEAYVPSDMYNLLIHYMDLIKNKSSDKKYHRHYNYLKAHLRADQTDEFHALIDKYVTPKGDYMI